MKKVWEKISSPEGLVKHDAFSDLRNSIYSGLGLSQQTLDVGNQVLNTAVGLMPAGGSVPNSSVQNANSALPQSTAPTFIDQIMSPKIAGIPIIPVVVVGLLVVLIIKK